VNGQLLTEWLDASDLVDFGELFFHRLELAEHLPDGGLAVGFQELFLLITGVRSLSFLM
jgi:hypothetical protein